MHAFRQTISDSEFVLLDYYRSIIIEKEGDYLTSLWYCVTTLYGVYDLCNDIHIQGVVSQFVLQHHIAAAAALGSL